MTDGLNIEPLSNTRKESIFRVFDGILALKDFSTTPSDNSDREAKLGNQQGARVGIICKFDAANKRRFVQDGITEGDEDVLWFFEPDNLCFRKHTNGSEVDRVWAFRAICDHSNKHNEKENRSTFIVDQRDKQKQGTFHEVTWIKDVSAKSSQPETKYAANGEWEEICQEGTPSDGGDREKYHACFNSYKQAGYITDGERIAQLKGVFKIQPFPTGVSTGFVFAPGCGECPPIAPDKELDGVPTDEGLKKANVDGDAYGELYVWSDIRFYQDVNHKGPLGIDNFPDSCPVGIMRFGGLLWSSRKGQRSDQIFEDPTNPNGKKEAEQEDSPAFGRITQFQWIRPWICIPRADIPTIPPNPVPPNGVPPFGEDTPRLPPTGDNGGWKTQDFPPSVTTGLQFELEVSPDLTNGDDLTFRLGYTTDAAPGVGDTVSTFLGFTSLKCDAGENTAAPETFLAAVILDSGPIEPTLPAASGDIKCLDFTIPGAAVEESDLLRLTVYRSKTDRFPGKFQLLTSRLISGDCHHG